MNTIMIGDVAPNFNGQTVNGIVNMYDYKKESWLLFCSHPADFTPICDGELCTMQNWKIEFDERNVKMIGLSVDKIESHLSWFKQFKEVDNLEFEFPIIADFDRKISSLYGMIREGQEHAKTARSMFIIDPDNKVRLTATYPAEVGRNFKEIIRTIDALQLATSRPIATPVNWEIGSDVVIHPTLSKDKYSEEFPQGWKEIKPYLNKVSL